MKINFMFQPSKKITGWFVLSLKRMRNIETVFFMMHQHGPWQISMI